MNENQTKIDLLRKEIESCSEKETAAIVSEAEKKAADTIAALEKELESQHDSSIRKITDDFRNSEKKRVSEVCFSEGKRVLIHRNTLVNDFFGKIEKRLTEIVETPRYNAYLSDCIKKADEFSPLTEGAAVHCRPCDVAALDGLLKGYNCSLKPDESINMGGIIISYGEKGMLLDLTVEAALENEREKFAALKEMQL